MDLERDWNNVQENRYKICTKDLCLFPSCDTMCLQNVYSYLVALCVFTMSIPILLFRVFTMYIPILLFYVSSQCLFLSCYTKSSNCFFLFCDTVCSKCLFLTWHTMSEDLLIWLSLLFVSSLHWLPHFLCWRRM